MRFRLAPGIITGAAVFTSLAPRTSAAQEMPENNGDDVSSADYRVDPSSTVVQGTPRVIGLAGAYVGIAEGFHGGQYNAASSAHRTLDSLKHVDTNFGASASIPAWVPGSNYFNGPAFEGSESLSILSVASNVQIGHFGVGLSAEAQHYSLDSQEDAGFSTREFRGNFGTLSLNLARAAHDRSWILGAGPVVSGVSLRSSANSVFSASGLGGQVGILLKPVRRPVRLGANFRTPLYQLSRLGTDSRREERSSVYSPSQIYQPWQFSFGGAWQFGSAVLNPRWIDPRALRTTRLEQRGLSEETASDEELEEVKKEVERFLRARRERSQRFGLLVSLQLTLVGPSRQTVNVVSVSGRETQTLKTIPVLSPRLGFESPVLPGRLTLRAGTYLEPSRARLGKSRVHGTCGFDLKLFEWGLFGLFPEGTGWRLSLAFDRAHDYLNSAVGIGTWH